MSTNHRREQERARRKQEILQAARAVFVDRGYRRATVDEIAQRAEIGKGTIYLYFESKEAVLAELMLQALAELGARLQLATDRISVLHPDEKLRAMAEAYFGFATDAPDYFRLLAAFDRGDFEQGISAERRDQIILRSKQTLDLVTQAIADGVAMGSFAAADPHLAADILWAALNGVLVLVANPIRRELVASDAHTLYGATVALVLRGFENR